MSESNNTLFALGLANTLLQTVRQAMQQGRDVSDEEIESQWTRIQDKRAEFEANRQSGGKDTA